jgi:hypothetical protein
MFSNVPEHTFSCPSPNLHGSHSLSQSHKPRKHRNRICLKANKERGGRGGTQKVTGERELESRGAS